MATSTVTGATQERNCFLNDNNQRDNVARDAIPWAQVRAHVATNFLNVGEAATLRDSLDQVRRSTLETDASFTRHFRDLAKAAFPVAARNDDQQRTMVRAYARDLGSSAMAVKMIEQDNLVTLEAAITWVNEFSGRLDAVSRLGLVRPGKEAMEIGTMPPPLINRTPQPPLKSTLDQVLRGQERLTTKLAKFEATQTRAQPQSSPRMTPGPRDRQCDWTADERPRRYTCGTVGHMRRNYPTKQPFRQGRFHAQPFS